MAVLTSTGITFGDATTQATAAVGIRGQVFTSSGTFTIPTGTTAIKVTVVAGGASSAGVSGCSYVAGTAGGTSSVASGTQTISTISATGGGTTPLNGNGNGGVGSGGDINIRGGGGGNGGNGGSSMAPNPGANTGTFGSSAGNGSNIGGAGGTAIKYLTGLTPGGTLTVTRGAGGGAPGSGYAGGDGVIIFEY